MTSDFELLDRWRAGDTQAGNQLVRRHFDSVCRFFQTKTQGDIDELVQATFLACTRALKQFAKRSSFRTYLYTIARHELYRHWRKQRRDGEALDFGATSLVDLVTSPSGKVAKGQRHKLLLQALRELPLEQQVLLELHYWEDMDIGELSEVFDIATGAMRGRLFRARKGLRERMERLEEDPAAGGKSIEDFEAWARSMRLKGGDVRGSDPAQSGPAGGGSSEN